MSDEKTEQPTEKKLEDARRDGEVSKSTDLTTAAVLLSCVIAMVIGGPLLGDALRALMSSGLQIAEVSRPDFDLILSIKKIAMQGAMLLLPFLVLSAVAAMLGIWMQTGINVSMKPVEMKFESINLAAGLKRIFSVRSLIDLLKMVIKAVLIFVVMWKSILLLAPLIVGVVYEPVLDIVQISWQVLTNFIAIGGVMFLILGAADFGVQRWLFIRDHRMSKDDIKREHKESEGDPQMKGQRKSIAKEMATTAPPRPTRAQIANAQAIIVNPTHFAVALRYDPREFGLPRVIAKGLDDDALDIRRLAQDLGIPIIGNPPLARALYTVPLEEAIPEALFETVAVILKWVKDIGNAGSDPTSLPGSSSLMDPI